VSRGLFRDAHGETTLRVAVDPHAPRAPVPSRLKRILQTAQAGWLALKPLEPQHRSRAAWLEHCAKTGKSPDGQ
jgi:hypothetical protein